MRIINEEFVRHVYRKAGDAAATALVKRRIAGTWSHEKTKKRLTVVVRP